MGNLTKNKHRGRMEIVEQVLEICKIGANKNTIYRKANLNFLQGKEYIQFCLNQNFLEKVDKMFFTTNRGFEFLDRSSQVRNLIQQKAGEES